jgi:hypothetical protein
MPYKIPNTFNAKTPLGQSVQNLMTSYFGNLPTPADTAKADYMNSTAEASKASAALNRQKYDANAGAQTVYENIINNPEGLSPEDAMKKNLAAYLANQQQSGNLATAGKTILTLAPWQSGNTSDTINKAQLGSGMATNNTLEGTLQHENFQNQRANIAQAGQDRRAANTATKESPAERQFRMKQEQKTKDQTGFKKGFEDTLNAMAGYYDSLQSTGDMVSIDNSPIKNVKNYLASTDIGQVAGGALGTEAQSTRDKVNNLLPQLMLDIKNATGMSAKQLDSDKDVQFIRQSLTNPKVEYSAVKAALQNLKNKYGLPSQSNASPSPSPMASPTPMTFDDLPDPAQFQGQILDNPDTGEAFMSNGTEWVAQ